MNKIFKKLLIIIIILCISIIPYFTYAETTSTEFKSGDLRCNPTYLGNGCEEVRNSITNEVESVRISAEQDGYKIIKVAEKTSIPGKIDIHFEAEGNLEVVKKETKYKNSDIVILLDYSGSFEESANNALKSITWLGEYVRSNRPNYRIAYAKFSRNDDKNPTKVIQNWTQTPISTTAWGKIASHSTSMVQLGLNLVRKKLFNNARDDAKKVLILVSDGGFWMRDSYAVRGNVGSATAPASYQIDYSSYCGSSPKKMENKYTSPVMETEAQELRDMGVEIYGIRYPGKYTDSTKSCWSTEDMYTIIGNRNAANLPQLQNNSSASDWEFAFQKLLGKIDSATISSTETVVVNGIDKVGTAFQKYPNEEKIFEINKSTKKSETFSVKIDPTVNTDWYPTNEGFNASIKIGDRTININSNINPEVYWKKENSKNELDSCSGVINKNNIYEENTDYYNIVCEEGYIENGKTYEGFTVDVNVADLEPGKKQFDATFGFNSEIKLSTNIKCTYKFNDTLYNKDYQNIIANINKETNENILASLYVKKEQLENIKSQFDGNLNNSLNSYKNNFSNIIPFMEIKNSISTNTINYIDKGDTDINVRYVNKWQDRIGGYLYSMQIGYLNASKTMYLPESCLNLNNGNQTSCSNKNVALYGSHKYYPNIDEGNGTISISIDNIMYGRDWNIKLDGNNCAYTVGTKKLIYRQIDISNPFIEGSEYNSGSVRGVGRNFLNNSYNFKNIIQSNLWKDENNFEYRYALSKLNVYNIQKDTLDMEEKVKSYLGSNCYLDKDNKYICSFTRNLTETGETKTNFFTTIEIK